MILRIFSSKHISSVLFCFCVKLNYNKKFHKMCLYFLDTIFCSRWLLTIINYISPITVKRTLFNVRCILPNSSFNVFVHAKNPSIVHGFLRDNFFFYAILFYSRTTQKVLTEKLIQLFSIMIYLHNVFISKFPFYVCVCKRKTCIKYTYIEKLFIKCIQIQIYSFML